MFLAGLEQLDRRRCGCMCWVDFLSKISSPESVCNFHRFEVRELETTRSVKSSKEKVLENGNLKEGCTNSYCSKLLRVKEQCPSLEHQM